MPCFYYLSYKSAKLLDWIAKRKIVINLWWFPHLLLSPAPSDNELCPTAEILPHPYAVPAILFGGLTTSYSKTKVDAYGITNLRVGIAGERWKVTAFARNLFDEEYVGEVIMAPEFGGAFVTPGTYRTAGVEFQ